MATFLTQRIDQVNPRHFGAVGNARRVFGATTTATTNSVTGPAASFVPEDVGRPIYISGAGVSGTPLITTVASYVSATSITVAAVATLSVAGTAQVVIGEDDTVALQAAIDYAAARAKSVVIDGRFVTGPLNLRLNSSLIGTGRDSARLFLKPGSATVNKYMLKPLNNAQVQCSISGITLIGLRTFQRDGSGNLLKDINGIDLDYTGGASDAQCSLISLVIKEFGRAGIRSIVKGRNHIADVMGYELGYGLEVDSADNVVTQVSMQAYACGFFLRSGAKGNHFSNCKAYRCGYDAINATVGEYACWYLNAANNNDFAGCEGQESWGSVWYLIDSKRNNFSSCRGSDAGCLYPQDGLGADNAALTKADFWLAGASDDNRFAACNAGVGAHGVTNAATHAVLVEGTSANNTGTIQTDKNAGAWLTAKLGRTTSGIGNRLFVDDEAITRDRYAVPVDAWQITPRFTNGPAINEIELPSNKMMLHSLDFDNLIQEYGQFKVLVPPSVDLSAGVTADYVWSHTTGATAYGVAISLSIVGITDAGAMDVASGTPVIVTDVGGTANTNYKTAECGTVSVSGSIAALVEVTLEVSRAVADAGDTLDKDMRLHGMRVYFKYKAGSDN